MSKKHYSQSIKDEAVLFYELGHSFVETQAKYGMAESTFFTWKQKFDKAHPMHEAITTNRTTCHKSKRHLEKLALELEVLRQCPCGRNASIDEKVAAVNALCGRYSIHVLCDALSLPRGTYYNRKRREGQRTSYEINDEKLKPLIRQIFHDSKNRFGRKPVHHKLAELGYKVSEKRIVRPMKEMGLSVAKPRYKAEHQKSLPRAYFRNLLARQFDQPQPNLIWVSDITYIKVLDQYKIHTSLSEYYIDRITTGLPATINYQGKRYPLKITKVVPEVKDRMFDVDLIFTGEMPDNVRVGKSFRVQIELGQPEQAIVIPRGNFYQVTGGQWVYKVNASKTKAIKVPLTIGRQNPQQYEITEGLQPGELVVVTGYDTFGDAEELILK